MTDIRTNRKCAVTSLTCHRQTEMFSVYFWRWPAISVHRGCGGKKFHKLEHEQKNCSVRNLSLSVEWRSRNYWQIACDCGQHPMVSTSSALSGKLRRHEDTYTQWLLSWKWFAAEQVGRQCRLHRNWRHVLILCGSYNGRAAASLLQSLPKATPTKHAVAVVRSAADKSVHQFRCHLCIQRPSSAHATGRNMTSWVELHV